MQKKTQASISAVLVSGMFPQSGRTAVHPLELWHRGEESAPASSDNHKPICCIPAKSLRLTLFCTCCSQSRNAAFQADLKHRMLPSPSLSCHLNSQTLPGCSWPCTSTATADDPFNFNPGTHPSAEVQTCGADGNVPPGCPPGTPAASVHP